MSRGGGESIPLAEPMLALNPSPGQPFTSTAEREVVNSCSIPFNHLPRKPLAPKIVSKLSQLTESKALANQALGPLWGIYLWWQC